MLTEYIDQDTGEVTDITYGDETTALVPTKTTEVMVASAPQFVSPDQLPNFDEMEAGSAIAAKYLEFTEAGQSVRGVFSGFTTMQNKKKETIKVANFQNQDGVFVNAGANLTGQLFGVPPGTPVQVTYKGTEDTKNGNKVKVFEIRVLSPKHPAQRAPVADMNLKAGGVAVPSKQTYTEKDFVELVRSSHTVGSSEFVKKNITPVGVDWTAAYLELKAILPA